MTCHPLKKKKSTLNPQLVWIEICCVNRTNERCQIRQRDSPPSSVSILCLPNFLYTLPVFHSHSLHICVLAEDRAVRVAQLADLDKIYTLDRGSLWSLEKVQERPHLSLCRSPSLSVKTCLCRSHIFASLANFSKAPSQFSVPLLQVHKLKHLTMQSAFTSIHERMARSKVLTDFECGAVIKS